MAIFLLALNILRKRQGKAISLSLFLFKIDLLIFHCGGMDNDVKKSFVGGEKEENQIQHKENFSDFRRLITFFSAARVEY